MNGVHLYKLVLSIPNFCAPMLNPRQIAALVDLQSRALVCTMKYRFFKV